MDDRQTDALAVRLCGEERSEEIAGGFFRYGQAVVGYAPVARPGDNGNLIPGKVGFSVGYGLYGLQRNTSTVPSALCAARFFETYRL